MFKVVLIHVYSKTEVKECLLIIALYVDDVVLASNDVQMLKVEKGKLKKQFEMEDSGEIHHCLSMSIRRDRAAKELTIS